MSNKVRDSNSHNLFGMSDDELFIKKSKLGTKVMIPSIVFLSVVGIAMIIFYIRMDMRNKKQFDREMEYLDAKFEKLLKGGDQYV